MENADYELILSFKPSDHDEEISNIFFLPQKEAEEKYKLLTDSKPLAWLGITVDIRKTDSISANFKGRFKPKSTHNLVLQYKERILDEVINIVEIPINLDLIPLLDRFNSINSYHSIFRFTIQKTVVPEVSNIEGLYQSLSYAQKAKAGRSKGGKSGYIKAHEKFLIEHFRWVFEQEEKGDPVSAMKSIMMIQDKSGLKIEEATYRKLKSNFKKSGGKIWKT